MIEERITAERIYDHMPLENKVVFSSFHGKKCAGDPKYISLYLHETHPEIPQVWICDESIQELNDKENIKVVGKNSDEADYHLSTAKVWIDNCHKELCVNKRNGQFFIQTWHEGISLLNRPVLCLILKSTKQRPITV